MLQLQEKVSRAELAGMDIGETLIFDLPDGGKVKSAISTCDQMKNEKGMEFEKRPDWKHAAICIKRIK